MPRRILKQINAPRANQLKRWAERPPVPESLMNTIRRSLPGEAQAIYDSIVSVLPAEAQTADRLIIVAMFAEACQEWLRHRKDGGALPENVLNNLVMRVLRLNKRIWVDEVTSDDKVHRSYETAKNDDVFSAMLKM